MKKETKKKILTMRVSPRIKAAYEELADRQERTISDLASETLSNWITEHHPHLIAAREPLFDSSGGICQVPLYDVRAAAGDGNFIAEENLEKQLELTRRFVTDLGTVPENLVGLRVKGNSMEPELHEEDVVLVNTHLDNGVPLEEDIYVFRMESDLYIKRLRPLPEGGVKVISTNPAYPPFEIPAEIGPGGFQVLGRLMVRWRESP